MVSLLPLICGCWDKTTGPPEDIERWATRTESEISGVPLIPIVQQEGRRRGYFYTEGAGKSSDLKGLADGMLSPSHHCNASCFNAALQVRILSPTFCQSIGSRMATGLAIWLHSGRSVR